MPRRTSAFTTVKVITGRPGAKSGTSNYLVKYTTSCVNFIAVNQKFSTVCSVLLHYLVKCQVSEKQIKNKTMMWCSFAVHLLLVTSGFRLPSPTCASPLCGGALPIMGAWRICLKNFFNVWH